MNVLECYKINEGSYKDLVEEHKIWKEQKKKEEEIYYSKVNGYFRELFKSPMYARRLFQDFKDDPSSLCIVLFLFKHMEKAKILTDENPIKSQFHHNNYYANINSNDGSIDFAYSHSDNSKILLSQENAIFIEEVFNNLCDDNPSSEMLELYILTSIDNTTTNSKYLCLTIENLEESNGYADFCYFLNINYIEIAKNYLLFLEKHIDKLQEILNNYRKVYIYD